MYVAGLGLEAKDGENILSRLRNDKKLQLSVFSFIISCLLSRVLMFLSVKVLLSVYDSLHLISE